MSYPQLDLNSILAALGDARVGMEDVPPTLTRMTNAFPHLPPALVRSEGFVEYLIEDLLRTQGLGHPGAVKELLGKAPAMPPPPEMDEQVAQLLAAKGQKATPRNIALARAEIMQGPMRGMMASMGGALGEPQMPVARQPWSIDPDVADAEARLQLVEEAKATRRGAPSQVTPERLETARMALQAAPQTGTGMEIAQVLSEGNARTLQGAKDPLAMGARNYAAVASPHLKEREYVKGKDGRIVVKRGDTALYGSKALRERILASADPEFLRRLGKIKDPQAQLLAVTEHLSDPASFKPGSIEAEIAAQMFQPIEEKGATVATGSAWRSRQQAALGEAVNVPFNPAKERPEKVAERSLTKDTKNRMLAAEELALAGDEKKILDFEALKTIGEDTRKQIAAIVQKEPDALKALAEAGTTVEAQLAKLSEVLKNVSKESRALVGPPKRPEWTETGTPGLERELKARTPGEKGSEAPLVRMKGQGKRLAPGTGMELVEAAGDVGPEQTGLLDSLLGVAGPEEKAAVPLNPLAGEEGALLEATKAPSRAAQLAEAKAARKAMAGKALPASLSEEAIGTGEKLLARLKAPLDAKWAKELAKYPKLGGLGAILPLLMLLGPALGGLIGPGQEETYVE